MRELVYELLLRLIKPALAALIGLVLWFVAIGPGGATASAELGLVCLVAGGVAILLVQEGPL